MIDSKETLSELIKSWGEPASNYVLDGNPLVVSLEEIDEALIRCERAVPSEVRFPEDEVERVAIAICPWHGKIEADISPRFVWKELSEEKKGAYRRQARAALKAMGLPKREIVDLYAGADAFRSATNPQDLEIGIGYENGIKAVAGVWGLKHE